MVLYQSSGREETAAVSRPVVVAAAVAVVVVVAAVGPAVPCMHSTGRSSANEEEHEEGHAAGRTPSPERLPLWSGSWPVSVAVSKVYASVCEVIGVLWRELVDALEADYFHLRPSFPNHWNDLYSSRVDQGEFARCPGL